MFDQTFVDGTQKTKKPLTLLASILMQISALSILLLIPLVYTATLPGAVLKSLLVAPPPPLHVVTQSAPKPPVGHIARLSTNQQFVAPVSIPEQVNSISDIGAPPEIAVFGSNGPEGPAGAPFAGAIGSNPEPPPLIEQAKPKPATGPIRIGTGAAEAKLLNKVIPLYPSLAQAARIQGSVEFSATISKDGNIENLQLVHGHPLLVKAARDAVLQWKYRPTLLNGQPVEVITSILVNFTLSQ